MYRLTNPGSSSRIWSSVIGNLRATEFWSIGYDTSTNTLLGGAQDTGSTEQTSSASLTWKEAQKADGGEVAVDTTSIPGQSIRYTTRQFLGNFNRTTFDSSGNQVSSANVGLAVSGSTKTLTKLDPNIRFLPFACKQRNPAPAPR